jgi:hypothetical protein
MRSCFKKFSFTSLIFFFHCILLTSVTAAPSYITFPSDVDWVTQTSPHFQILFRRGEETLAKRTLVAAENAFKLLQPVFDETPPIVWIVLADFHDSLNGYAIDFPFPHFVVFASPPEPSGQLSALDQWLDSVVLHELAHVFHLYPAHGFWSAIKTVFGNWVLPNGLMPSHLHEGMATFLETRFTSAGRGKGNSFRMIRRMAVKAGTWGKDFAPIDLMEGSSRWPQGQAPYFFGYHLYEELWARKGAQGIRDFVQSTSRRLPYLLGGAMEANYGEDYVSIWNSVFKKTQAETEKEIDALERAPLSKLVPVTQSGEQKWDLQLSPSEQHLAFQASSPQQGHSIEIVRSNDFTSFDRIEIEPGREDSLCWLKEGDEEYLVFTDSQSKEGYLVNYLNIYSLKTKQKKPLLVGDLRIEHTHAIACQGHTLFTFQETRGAGAIREWRMEGATLSEAKQVREWNLPTGEWVTAIAPSTPPLFLTRHSTSTRFYEWKESTPLLKKELEGHFFQLKPKLPTGEWPVVGSFQAREEVWGIHLERGTARKLVSVLGGVNSFARLKNEWIVSNYQHGGYDLARANELEREIKVELKPNVSKPVPVESAALSISEVKDYSAWSTIRPRAWIPSLLIVPDGMQISAWVPGFDISQKHLYNLFGGYDTRGSPFVFADYDYRFGRTQQISTSLNYSPSYLISSRAFLTQWGGSFGYSTQLGSEMPRVSVSVLYRKLENSSFGPANRSIGFALGISRTFGVKSPARSIAPRYGTSLSLSYSQFFQALGSTDNYYSLIAGADQYLPSPLFSRHVFKLAARFGFSEGTSLYNNFFQGGGELQFSPGRGTFLNRGFLPGLFVSQRMFCFNVDYLFPLVEIERGVSYVPFFLKRIDAALVLDVTTQGSFRYFYASTGAEIKSYWKTFFYFPTVVRVGGYHGFGPFGESFYATMAIEATI